MARTKQSVKQALKKLPANVRQAGPVAKIKALYMKGYDKATLIAAGFNKNTVYRQTREVDLA